MRISDWSSDVCSSDLFRQTATLRAASMTILLTGAGGQVGWEIKARGGTRKLVALDRAALDICDGSAVSAAIDRHRPSLLINAAAYTAVDKAESESEAAYAINRDGPAVQIGRASCRDRVCPYV